MQAAEQEATVVLCPIERLRAGKAGKTQPRSQIDSAGLDELADSIRQHGIIEPLVVRSAGTDQYEIVCGERRWRAAQRAGLLEVPIIVKKLSDDAAFEMAVSENLSRASLSTADFADACLRLANQGLTGTAIAKRFGCSGQMVSYALTALRNLPPQVMQLNREGQLSTSHLKVLSKVKEPKRALALAERAAREHLTPSQCAQALLQRDKPTQQRKPASTRDLELRFSRKTGMHCTVIHRTRSRGGDVTVTLTGSLDQLDDLIEKLDV